MTVPQPPSDPAGYRIGDAERTAALQALGEHLAAGRLDLAEFETRSAQVTAARTGHDLSALFVDLPGPAPVAELAVRACAPAAPVAASETDAERRRERTQALAGAAAGVAAIIAVVAYMLLKDSWDKAWLVFLLIPIVALITRPFRED